MSQGRVRLLCPPGSHRGLGVTGARSVAMSSRTSPRAWCHRGAFGSNTSDLSVDVLSVLAGCDVG